SAAAALRDGEKIYGGVRDARHTATRHHTGNCSGETSFAGCNHMTMESNYWLTTSSMAPATTGNLPAKADVAIIGAGFTGLSAARALAKKGVNVAVLEANTIGWGASSRNGGMVLTGLKLSA